jgi:nitrate/TMAO reductase-like tetraheme cytochrome c subunit
MKLLGTDAVGLSEKELRYGLAFLKQSARRSGTPFVCANLLDKKTGAPIFPPYLIKKVGTVRVGVFGLMNDKVAYGPSGDSLKVEEPTAAARRTIAEMKKKGATVVVLLSQLGKVEGEDLAAAVPGIDVLIIGHSGTLLNKGRMIKNTVAVYGGEQGQFMGQTVITLNAARAQATGDADVYMLGPEVGENAEVARLVKAFEDGFNEILRKSEQQRIAAAESTRAEQNQSPDRYLGAELCMRCHKDEADQWKTTSHSLAWQTLVNVKKEATPDCIPCHVVGFGKPGGFQQQSDAAKLGNVQCENCHGMGTEHEAFANPHKTVTEQVCITCHRGENDPEFNWATKRPKIVHTNMSGETIKNMKNTMGKPSGSQ